MGQAKRRGSFEQRKAAAILKKEEEARNKKPVYKAAHWMHNLILMLKGVGWPK